jgi:diguanylate cyclase (GGDEF)-like protein/PAS domain S-box-containing protein
MNAPNSMFSPAAQTQATAKWSLASDNGRMTYSGDVEAVFGLPLQALPETFDAYLGLVATSDRERVARALNPDNGYSSCGSLTHRIAWPGGFFRDVQFVWAHTVHPNGTIRCTEGFVITQHSPDYADGRGAENNPLLWSAFRYSPSGILLLQASDHRILLANDSAAQLLARPRTVLEAMRFEELYVPGEAGRLGAIPIRADRQGLLSENITFLSPDGKTVRCDISFSIFTVQNRAYAICMLSGPHGVRHITDVATELLRHSTEGLVLTDLDGNIVWVNDTWCEKTGYTAEESVGRNQRLVRSGLQDNAFYREMWGALKKDGNWDGELWNRRKDGKLFREILRIRKVEIPSAGAAMYLGMMKVVNNGEAQPQPTHAAHFDQLTGLPNRHHAEHRLADEINRSRDAGKSVNVLCINTTGVQNINHMLGLKAGDRLLTEISGEISRLAPSPLIAGRMSGAEFVILQPDADSVSDAISLADRINARFDQQRSAGRLPDGITISVGVCNVAGEVDDAGFWLRTASVTASEARNHGSGVRVFRHSPPDTANANT